GATCARNSAAEHELGATACSAPTYSRNAPSKRATFGPVPSQPARSEPTTSAISSSPMAGLPKTMYSPGADKGNGMISAPSAREDGHALAEVLVIAEVGELSERHQALVVRHRAERPVRSVGSLCGVLDEKEQPAGPQ